MIAVPRKHSSRFPSNSEANASEFLENLGRNISSSLQMVKFDNNLFDDRIRDIIRTFSVSGMEEFCESETFRTECKKNEVVITESAFYGRMRLGRCVMLNMGYIGCGHNVQDQVDRRCSGKQGCEIKVPDTELEATKPCLELKSYLEVHTRCQAGKFKNVTTK